MFVQWRFRDYPCSRGQRHCHEHPHPAGEDMVSLGVELLPQNSTWTYLGEQSGKPKVKVSSRTSMSYKTKRGRNVLEQETEAI